jgi:nitroimidazol reductase NimA-like FMN-containing flavoprotein (pyridoxamine 5'-phosphate oxidase superfamily)
MDPEPTAGTVPLARDECLARLRALRYLGRVGFVSRAGRPLVLPVNYVVDGDSVVFSTAAGSELGAMSLGAPVAFEIDEIRALYHAGWSVLVQGTAHPVTDPEEVARLRRGPLRSWARGARERWVRISIDEISGRAVGPP